MNMKELKSAVTAAAKVVTTTEKAVAKLEKADPVDKAALKTAKAEARAAVSEHKKAEKAIVQFEKAEAKEAAKAEKAKAAEERKAATAAKKKEREEAKAKKIAEREANQMPVQNDIRRPKPGTKCAQVWDIADKISAKLKSPAPVNQVMEQGRKAGLEDATIKTQYARWRKFNDITGRVVDPTAAKEKAA